MNLSEKLRHLRYIEGLYRGLNRPITKAEMLRAMQDELGQSISHAYLSQLESGIRTHMSPGTRLLLASFFKVHPGYLVGDPDGYKPTMTTTEMFADNGNQQDALRRWLRDGEIAFLDNVQLSRTLKRIATAGNPERFLHLVAGLLSLPENELDEIEQRISAHHPDHQSDNHNGYLHLEEL